MKRLFLCAALAFLPAPSFAQNDPVPQASLFFSPRDAHEAEMQAQRLIPAGKGDIHLGAVLYYGPNDWVFWLQGEKWTPSTTRKNIRIEEVSAAKVRLVWQDPERPAPVKIELKPNQSYQISTGKIIDAP